MDFDREHGSFGTGVAAEREQDKRTHLIIGGDGLIGSALRCALQNRNVIATTRRLLVVADQRPMFTLGVDDPRGQLPIADVIYLVAAIGKFQDCAGSAESWLVNVDAQIDIVRNRHVNSRIVFVSSDCVEWSVEMMAIQKRQVELFVLLNGGIVVRPSRVAPERANDLASFIVDCSSEPSGVYRWVTEES